LRRSRRRRAHDPPQRGRADPQIFDGCVASGVTWIVR
jgi:hypothetical protein